MARETCVHCGKNVVYVRPCQQKRGYHPKCDACKGGKVKKTCSNCNEEFEVSDNKFATKYCSDKCREEAKGERQCLGCPNKFVPNSDTQKFCSKACASKYNHAMGRIGSNGVNGFTASYNSFDYDHKAIEIYGNGNIPLINPRLPSMHWGF